MRVWSQGAGGTYHPTLWGPGNWPPKLPSSITPARKITQQFQDRLIADTFLHRLHQLVMRNRRKAIGDIRLDHPPAAPPALVNEHLQGIVRRPSRAEPETGRRKSASKTGSSTIFTAACTIRSRTGGIENGRCSPRTPGFGMKTLRAGSGRYRPSSTRPPARRAAGLRRTPRLRPG